MNKFLPLTKRTILTWLFFWAVAYGYLVNITHDVYSGDIGDLTTAAYFFGVPHPPGYPTLTLLGFLFSRIPIALPIISRISLVSLCAALLGLIFYFKFAIEILTGQIVGKKTPVWIILFIGIFATSLLAFSYLYWLYAEIPEVFALSNCLLIILCLEIPPHQENEIFIYYRMVCWIVTYQPASYSRGFSGYFSFYLSGIIAEKIFMDYALQIGREEYWLYVHRLVAVSLFADCGCY